MLSNHAKETLSMTLIVCVYVSGKEGAVFLISFPLK